MTKRAAVSALITVVAAFLVSVCTDLTDVPSTEGPADRLGDAIDVVLHAREQLRAAALGRQERSTEDELLRIERDLPGFGGMYVDTSTQRLTLFVRNPRDVQGATNALRNAALDTESRARIPEISGLASSDIDLRQGEYAFSELVAWKDQLFSRLSGVDALLSIDADESRNQVAIEIAHPGARSDVRAVLSTAGVPESAVRIEIGTPVSMLADLTQQRRPAVAGYQIRSETSLCAMGWNVRTIQEGEVGFFTASHCSRFGLGSGATGETIYQRNVDPRDDIGTVRRNTAWTPPGSCGAPVDPFPPGTYPHRCTNADAMFVRAFTSADISGQVAITTELQDRNNRPGTRTIDFFTGNIIVGGVLAGQLTDKVGRTTGWTRGTNTGTCMTVRVNDGHPTDEYAVFCAGRITSASVGQGDSGAPVFRRSGSTMLAAGVLFAGGRMNRDTGDLMICDRPPGEQCNIFYSPWSRVESHLGRTFEPSP
ncbi:MAG: hypothetical protein ACREM1_06670 [Longimicrobiales bacterium]